MQDPRDNRIGTDDNGNLILLDENGRPVRDEFGNYMPPMKTTRSRTSSGFTTYDTSQGHCGLCGRLTCRGGCFK